MGCPLVIASMSQFRLTQSHLKTCTQIDLFLRVSSVTFSWVTQCRTSSHLPTHTSIFTGGARAATVNRVLFFLFLSSIICLSLFIPQSTVRCLEGLRHFRLSNLPIAEPLFHVLNTIRARQSASEQFPHVNTTLFFSFSLRKRLIHLICCRCTGALWTAISEEKPRSCPSNCLRVILADPPVIQRNRSSLSLKRFRSRAVRHDWHLLRFPRQRAEKRNSQKLVTLLVISVSAN